MWGLRETSGVQQGALLYPCPHKSRSWTPGDSRPFCWEFTKNSLNWWFSSVLSRGLLSTWYASSQVFLAFLSHLPLHLSMNGAMKCSLDACWMPRTLLTFADNPLCLMKQVPRSPILQMKKRKFWSQSHLHKDIELIIGTVRLRTPRSRDSEHVVIFVLHQVASWQNYLGNRLGPTLVPKESTESQGSGLVMKGTENFMSRSLQANTTWWPD